MSPSPPIVHGPGEGVWVWRDEPIEPREIVVVDVDGVISDASHRQWYLDGPHKDWKGFFEASSEDVPLLAGLGLVDLFDERLGIVLLTARPSSVLPKTVDWLLANEVRWDLLVMRREGDGRLSPKFKLAAVEGLRAYGFDPLLALDDDVRNIEMFEQAGITPVYLHSGYYEA